MAYLDKVQGIAGCRFRILYGNKAVLHLSQILKTGADIILSVVSILGSVDSYAVDKDVI